MAFRVTIAVLLTYLFSTTGYAEESIKRAIFEDCDRARTEFAKLPVEQKTALVSFLTRVISLNTQSPSAPEAYAVVPGAQLSPDTKGLSAPRPSELIPSPLWQSMDAKRELRAKKCSLELLQNAGATAISALVPLIATYSDQPLSDEIAVSVEEVVVSVAETANLEGLSLRQEDIDSISRYAFGPRPFLARNIIHEFRQIALLSLLKEVATHDIPKTDELTEYLQTLDPDGSRSLRVLMTLARTLSPEQFNHLRAMLPIPSRDLLLPLVPELLSLASEPLLSRTIVLFLGDACLALNGLPLNVDQQRLLAGIPDVLSIELPIEGVRCLLQSSPPLADKAREMLTSSNTAQRAHAVNLCSEGLQGAPATTRNEAYNILRREALNTESPLWKEYLSSLVGFHDRKKDTLQLIQQILKTSEKLDPQNKQVLHKQAFQILARLKLGTELKQFSRTILHSLRSADPDPYAVELAKLSPTLSSEIFPLATVLPPSKNSITALQVLVAYKTIPIKALPGLVDLVQYPECRNLATEGLLKGPHKTVTSQLRKTSTRLQKGLFRTSLLATLLMLDAITKTELNMLTLDLAGDTDCSVLTTNQGLSCKLSELHNKHPSVEPLVTQAIHRCLAEFSSDQLSELAQCNPSALLRSGDTVRDLLQRSPENSRLLEPMVALAIKHLSQGNDDASNLLTTLLQYGDQKMQIQTLDGLSSLQSLPESVQAAIRSLVSTTTPENPLFTHLAHAASLTPSAQYDWAELVRRAIASASSGNIPKDISDMIPIIPIDVLIAEALPALESENEDKMIGAALVGAALGMKAIPLVSRIWHLRTTRSPKVRYIATLALLKINPLTPDLDDAVKRILANRFFQYAKIMSIDWSHTVAINDLDRATLGVLRNARLAQLLTGTHPPENIENH